MCIPLPTTGTTNATDTALTPASELSEAVLAAIWNEQAPLRGPMWDSEGKPVAVVYRGRWTAGIGPDFEGAMLSLGEEGALANGSVEMHLRCEDWWAHGHHANPRYNSVALHVVLWPHAARPVLRQDGVSVPTLVLADYITLPTSELLRRVTPLIPNLGALSEEPCWGRTQGRPLEELLSAIDRAGDARLLAKAARMEAELCKADLTADALQEAFYGGLMEALGYSANREPMQQLASALPISQLLTLPLGRDEGERALLLEAILLGAAGFLPSQRPALGPADWLSQQYGDEVERLWQANAPMLGLQSGRPLVSGWTTTRVRPANSPQRRLAAAARLLARLLWAGGGMLGPFTGTACSAPAVRLAKEWTAQLIVPGEGYWGAHSDFGQPMPGCKDDTALVGKSRAADITVNIVLPLLLAQADLHDDPSLHGKVLAVYAAYPKLAENNITRAMADEALGPRKKSINGARRQQGLIHLYRLYCQARRCYECPLSGMRRAECET